MQLASIMLNLGGDIGNQVPKYNVTPSEVHILQLLHGNDAVTDIEIVDDVKRSSRAERERLMEVYARTQPDGSKRSPVIDSLFPGVAARLYETFEEMEIDETFFKAERFVAPKPKAAKPATEPAKKPLGDMSKAELAAYAKASGIEFDAAANKAALLATIQEATAGDDDTAEDADEDDDDDGIEDMNDGKGGKNLFE